MLTQIVIYSGHTFNGDRTFPRIRIASGSGLDTISTGSSIGFAYEIYEKGLLKKADTNGLELVYGQHEPILALINKISRREGIGDLLAEGPMRAAVSTGKDAEECTINVKGMELPAFEPRDAKSQSYNYVTAKPKVKGRLLVTRMSSWTGSTNSAAGQKKVYPLRWN